MTDANINYWNYPEQQIAQSRPSGTSETQVYSPSRLQRTMIRHIFVCNTTASNVDFSIYHDNDGTTYDESSALFFESQILANEVVQIETLIAMGNPDGNLAVKSSVGNALTFTFYGGVYTVG